MLAGTVVAWAFTVWLALDAPHRFLDLSVYRAGGRAWVSGIPLYGPEFSPLVELFPLPFLYPPISAVLFVGLAVVPFPVAAVLLTAASLGCLAFVGWLTARRLESDRWRVIWLASAAVVLGTLTEPVRETLTFGQINLLLMGLVVADCLLPRTYWPRGTLIGLAAAIKLTPVVFVLYFLAHRQWRPVLAASAAFVVATAVGFLAAPAASVTYWLGGVLTVASRIGSPGFFTNQSLTGLLHRLGFAAPWLTALWLVAALAVLAACGVAVRRLRSRGRDVAALLAVAAAALLASPLSWSHHYVWAVPALLWCARQAVGSPRWWLVVMALTGVFAVGPHWLVATGEDNLPDWGAGEQIVGNAYVWMAMLVLLVAALGRLAPHPGVPDQPSSGRTKQYAAP